MIFDRFDTKKKSFKKNMDREFLEFFVDDEDKLMTP